ncbi:DUF2188 domain-containing protein [Cupriavidus lacunae]|nr:DUF2188 domain-containing protein [Cupriavidus lacunae]
MPADVGWVLEIDGLVERPHKFPTLEAAIDAGWDRARRENIDLQIHDLDVALPGQCPTRS